MKPMTISNPSIASSILAATLVLLSGTLGVLNSASALAAATGPTITVSPDSGSPILTSENYFGKYAQASNITVTGTGFPWDQNGIAIGLIQSSVTVTPSAVLSNELCLMNPSIGSTTKECSTVDGDSGVTTVNADADGYFQAQFQVPSVEGSPADTYNVAATYSTSSGLEVSNSVPFNVVPAAAVFSDATGTSSGTYNSRVDIEAAGFAPDETIDVVPSTNFLVQTPWGSTPVTSFVADSQGTTAGDACAYPTTVGTPATYTTCDGGFLSDRPQGALTVTLIGLDSGITATTTFTATPSIEFTNAGRTTLALTSSPNSANFVVHNFPRNTTLPANNLTIGGVSTIHPSASTNSEGLAGPISFTYVSGLPPGPVSAVFDGMAFSHADENIVAPPALETFQEAEEYPQAGILISTTSTISYVSLDQSTHAVDDLAYVFGVCSSNCGTPGVFGGPGTSPTATYTTTLAGLAPESYSVATSDSISRLFNLASVGQTIYAAGESETALTTSEDAYWLAFAVPYSYGGPSTATLTVSAIDGGASPPPVSLSIVPSVGTQGITHGTYYNTDVTTIDNSFNTARIAVTGFNPADPSVANPSASVYLGNKLWFLCSVADGAWSFNTTYPGTATCAIPGTSPVPDVGSGWQTLWVNGTTASNRGRETLSVEPLAYASSLSLATDVTVGTSVGLLTEPGAGVHGLAANTRYTVEYSGQSVMTFTSTSAGQVPPGVQFTVPAGPGGAHIVNVVTSSGVSAFYGVQVSTLQQYTNLIITCASSFTLTPSAGNVGSSITMTGVGLGASTTYYVWIPLCPQTGEAGLSCASTYVSYASFATDATGAVQARSGTLAFPAIPTNAVATGCAGSATLYEAGTLVTVYAAARWDDIGAVSPSAPVATSPFILEAQLTLAGPSASAGGSVSYTARGLCANTGYNIVFNYTVTPSGMTFTGTTVGSLLSGSNGEASGSFTVPAGVAAGTYLVQLTRIGAPPTVLGVLSAAPSLTVGAASTPGLTTTTLTPVGTASEAGANGIPTISQSYTSSYTSPLQVWMWVDVYSGNSSVGVFIGSATINAGQTVNVVSSLNDLPAGTYVAQVFATTTSGIPVSATSTTDSFTVQPGDPG